jgi:hypothetical protein
VFCFELSITYAQKISSTKLTCVATDGKALQSVVPGSICIRQNNDDGVVLVSFHEGFGSVHEVSGLSSLGHNAETRRDTTDVD